MSKAVSLRIDFTMRAVASFFLFILIYFVVIKVQASLVSSAIRVVLEENPKQFLKVDTVSYHNSLGSNDVRQEIMRRNLGLFSSTHKF